MCSVFKPTKQSAWVQEHFGVNLPATVAADVYPGHAAPIIVKSHRDGRVAVGMARFGLIPARSKDDKIGRHTYNARTETVAEKPSFRSAWRNRHFAIVLADGFYEPSYETGRAVRWEIKRAGAEPMGIAGIWDKWTHPVTGEVIVSFTMLTINAAAHPVMRKFHRPEDEKRTPMVLDEQYFQDWLSATPLNATSFLRLDAMPALAAEPALMVK